MRRAIRTLSAAAGLLATTGLLATSLLPLGCAADAATRSAFAERDSSGIRIAESTAPAWDDATRWHYDAEPYVVIGANERRPGHELYDVSGVARLADGRLAVVNGGSVELRIFADDGTLLRTVGRRGDGPGEFQSMRGPVLLPGDSVLLFDTRLGRITVITPEGVVARTAQLEPQQTVGVATPLAMLADGSLLARPSFTFGVNAEPGLHRDSIMLVRYAADGTALGPVGSFAGDEMFIFREDRRVFGGALAFGKRTGFAAGPDGIVYGSADAAEVEVRAPDGALQSVIRLARDARPVTEEHRRRLAEPAESEPGGSAEMDAFFARMLAATPFPERLPAYSRVLLDTEQHIWLLDYRLPFEPDTPETWQVLDPSGRWLGALQLPPRFELHRVSADELIGVWRDDFDVEQVHVLRLHRGNGPRIG